MTARRPTFHVVDGRTVHDLLSAEPQAVVAAVEDAYRAHHQGRTINPDSYFLRFPDRPDSRIIALPAHLSGTGDDGLSGIKWIASFPRNIEQGLPRASATLILNDGETGYPIACMEASIISAMRTAASAVSGAARLLGRADRRVERMAVIGTGLIARFTLQLMIATGWSIGTLALFDRSADYARGFADRMVRDHGAGGLSAQPEDSAEAAIAGSEVVLFTTTAGTPWVTDPGVLADAPVVLHVSLRDLSPEIVLAGHNVVDDVDHCLKAQTSPHLAEQQVGHRDFVSATLPALIAGDAEPPPRDRPVIFSPFGMGILDLAVGQLVLDRAIAAGWARSIDDFFWELARF